MKITISEQDGRLVAALCGDLDNVASSQAEQLLAPVFVRKDCDIVLDCGELNYISSSGLRILLRVFKHTRANGHKAVLRGLKDDVKEVLQLSGFVSLFVLEP